MAWSDKQTSKSIANRSHFSDCYDENRPKTVKFYSGICLENFSGMSSIEPRDQ